jgi:CBS domain containing-hemolysin-like protein
MGYSTLVIGLSILFSALFSGMEIAFISANKLKIELERKQSTFASHIINIFTRNPSQYIATMLVGNNIALVVYGIAMAKLMEPTLLSYISSPIGLMLAQTLLSTAVILVTAEFIPKSLFLLQPNGFLNFFCLPMLFFYIIFYPISKITTWLSVGIIKYFLRQNIKLGEEKRIFGKVDLDHFVGEAQGHEGENTKHEKDIKIFQNALEFSEVRVRECMIPRTDIEAIDVNSSIMELKDRFISTNYSRLPVFENSIDNIIGYVNCKDLFKKPQSIKSKLLKVEFIPETMRANKLLASFIKDQKSIAIVVDEFGGTAGLVTIEDIIEEIFGEIDDEHDMSEFIEKQLTKTEFIFSGRLEVSYLNYKYKLNIPEAEDYDTLAGFILSIHQSIPKPQEIIILNDFRIKVAKMDGSRIDLLYLKKLSKN